jgi:hypothetical protein
MLQNYSWSLETLQMRFEEKRFMNAGFKACPDFEAEAFNPYT